MPLYEYICDNDKCETETFDVLSSFEDSEEICPKCKEKSKERKKFYQFDFKMQGLVIVQAQDYLLTNRICRQASTLVRD